MFPFGAVTVIAMSPFLSVVTLTSIVVEHSMQPALSDNPPAAAAAVSSSAAAAPTTLVLLSDESELPPETSTESFRLYF